MSSYWEVFVCTSQGQTLRSLLPTILKLKFSFFQVLGGTSHGSGEGCTWSHAGHACIEGHLTEETYMHSGDAT